ncbi:hypothetical protein PHOSAC3_140110 [Mesotoga infera]|nr:hypothetical protein PHOSAC3_140110 [Mesotoga infera]
MLLGNDFIGRWYTIDPTRIGNGIINSEKALCKDNSMRSMK